MKNKCLSLFIALAFFNQGTLFSQGGQEDYQDGLEQFPVLIDDTLEEKEEWQNWISMNGSFNSETYAIQFPQTPFYEVTGEKVEMIYFDAKTLTSYRLRIQQRGSHDEIYSYLDIIRRHYNPEFIKSTVFQKDGHQIADILIHVEKAKRYVAFRFILTDYNVYHFGAIYPEEEKADCAHFMNSLKIHPLEE